MAWLKSLYLGCICLLHSKTPTQASLINAQNFPRPLERRLIIRKPHLPTPIEDVGIGGIAVAQFGPAQSEHALKEDGRVLEGTVWMGAHLSSIEELPLFLLLHALLRGHKSGSQVHQSINKCQSHNHAITINSCGYIIKDTYILICLQECYCK